jgi:tRNA-dihydrouridine synthase B
MLKIGPLEFPTQVLLAPLCGITDSAFRRLCRAEGATITYSEMTVSDGVIRANETTQRLMRFTEAERPYGIQLCGSSPDIMAEAARQVTSLAPDLIDINLGCPVRKVVDRRAGSALLAAPEEMEAIVRATVNATPLPVTVKMRIGWDEKTKSPVETARRLEGCGVKSIALHARTRAQGFSGKADWSVIADIKNAVSIPVIGNGDVLAPEESRRMLDETGCDAVMIGRGALGNPWIFSRTLHYLKTGEVLPVPDIFTRIDMALLHLEYMSEDKGPDVAAREIRKHLPGYLKGEQGAHRVRNEIHGTKTAEDMRRVLLEFAAELRSAPPAAERWEESREPGAA